ncbi:hypothetical protein PPRY_a2828 [Pseudoalteromonas prydzensis ACAM 620]|nr:hypothetical protein [Pseudoalteromonas prydzensis ACAM 620]
MIILVHALSERYLQTICLYNKHSYFVNLLSKYCQIMTIIARNEQNSGKLKN